MKKSSSVEFGENLERSASRFGIKPAASTVAQLTGYYELLLHWNPKLHLVAPCSPGEFATRHVLESLLLLPHLTRKAHVVDVGSGAGLPIVPCLVARDDIQATLIEASPKKAVFLREALSRLGLNDRAAVSAERFEKLDQPEADAITCRALNRFSNMLPRLIAWAPATAKLFLFGGDALLAAIREAEVPFEIVPVPESERRRLFILTKTD
ncbi:MAG: 16S rRNA (guanine(527)-N(7))-methyltransferase RsmG [Pyrinomonadaceae bacterium]